MPPVTMAAFMLAVFTVSVGFGLVLPLLPSLIERLQGTGVEAAQVARHTGLLTGVYTLALFLFAPLWGRISDRLGRRGVLLIGLVGLGVVMLASVFLLESLAAVYAGRFLSGVFASAVTPVAAAAIGDVATTGHGRARRLAFLNMAGMAGFLLGPMLSVLITRFSPRFLTITGPTAPLMIPLAATALIAFLAGVAVVFAVPGGQGHHRPTTVPDPSNGRTAWIAPRLLALTFIVSAGVGVFEVGLALRGKQELGLTPYQIAVMFTECSLVMSVIQAIVFSPWFKPEMTSRLIAPALAVLAAGLLLVPFATDFRQMLAVIAAVSASAGILSPVLTYWISSKAGNAQGWELGRQTAASSLGVTLGSAVAGLLFNITVLPGAPFVSTAALVALGFVMSLGLARLLVPRKLVNSPDEGMSEHLTLSPPVDRSQTDERQTRVR